MANYIKGNAVTNATSYTLHKKSSTDSALNEAAIATQSSSGPISFNLDDLVEAGTLTAGSYVFAVKAHADGYLSSEYSNLSSPEFVVAQDPNVPVALTAANTNPAYNDVANHLNHAQTAGTALSKSNVGTKGIYGWDIPAQARVTLTVSGGGNYGMAITDTNDIVLEALNNHTIAPNAGEQGTYTFSPVVAASRFYVSTTKFVSASYKIEEEMAEDDFTVMIAETSEVGSYISASQKVGSPVQIATMGGTYYMVSQTIPANTTTTLNVKTGGSYGMCIADLDGIVLESKPSSTADADGNIVFSKQTVPYRLWVSKTKYNSAKYSLK